MKSWPVTSGRRVSERPEAIGITYSVNSGKDKAGRLRTHKVADC